MMNPFRCQICGEAYLGPVPSDRCAFCGAAVKYLVPAAEWRRTGKVDLCEQSAADIKQAIGLEVNNSAFYTACRRKAQNQIGEAIFARLAKQELEHAELECDMLGIELPELPAVEAPETDEEKFAESHRRERRASTMYLQFAERAPEPRVKEVFYAISDIESEHLKVSNNYR